MYARLLFAILYGLYDPEWFKDLTLVRIFSIGGKSKPRSSLFFYLSMSAKLASFFMPLWIFWYSIFSPISMRAYLARTDCDRSSEVLVPLIFSITVLCYFFRRLSSCIFIFIFFSRSSLRLSECCMILFMWDSVSEPFLEGDRFNKEPTMCAEDFIPKVWLWLLITLFGTLIYFCLSESLRLIRFIWAACDSSSSNLLVLAWRRVNASIILP